MNFQSQTLWIIILITFFYMYFEMVESLTMCWLDIIFKKLSLQFFA